MSCVSSTVAKSAYYMRLWASFFVKLREKNPWSRVAVFWAHLKKYGCLFGKSDKQLRFLFMFAIFSNASVDTLSARS